MSRIAATLLSLEAVVLLLAIPVAVVVSEVEPGIAVPLSVAVAVALLVAAALLRRGKAGYVLGSVLQVVVIAAGFAVTVMFFLGGLFALLWLVLLRIGPDVEQAGAADDGGGNATT